MVSAEETSLWTMFDHKCMITQIKSFMVGVMGNGSFLYRMSLIKTKRFRKNFDLGEDAKMFESEDPRRQCGGRDCC